jgi:release factor glutamine methyltransferase
MIVDFGTGSGCIAIALAKNIPGSEVLATDISAEALSVAAENAALNYVSVKFMQEDIFSGKTKISAKPGIIVSNPPYVRSSEKASMNRNVLDYEPHNALFVTDSDPLIYYRAILQIADKIITDGGRIYFEINEALGAEMLSLMKGSGYADAVLVQDINGKDRIIKGTRNG